MVDPALLRAVAGIRQKFLGVVESLGRAASFKDLLAGTERLRADWSEVCEVAGSPRVKNPPPPSFSCAFVGSSGDGKTSVLAEMFPDLQSRGWQVTNVNDTTSQALCIRLAAPGSAAAGGVVIRSWSLEQIDRLVRAAAAENERANIKVAYQGDRILVDGEEAVFNAVDVARFRLPRRTELRPLPRPYALSAEEAADAGLIRALTVKEESDRLRAGPILHVDGQAFDILQLRAAIKEIDLRDDFRNIIAWVKGAAEAASLAFVDTPGLKAGASIKDEILAHVLGKKNQQIIVEMLRNDELDVIIHLVLGHNQSAFSQVWKAVVEQCSPDEWADLSDRLVLAINGVNMLLTNPDLSRRERPEVAAQEGDLFSVVVEDNILKKMSERGTVHPARICLLDCARIVAHQHGDYATFYAAQKARLLSWGEPGSHARPTLERLGMADAYRENIEALCDPSDRGQGFLVRQVVSLLRQNGAKLFLRKQVVRSRLLGAARKVRDGLLRHYDPDGRLNSQAIQAAVKAYLKGLSLERPESIEQFAAAHADPVIEQILPSLSAPPDDPQKWLSDAFHQLCKKLYFALIEQAKPKPAEQAAKLFHRFVLERINRWHEAWGYKSAQLPPPTRQYPATRDLASQALRLHAREILYQLLLDSAGTDAKVHGQEAADIEIVRQGLASLQEAVAQAETLCRQHEVTLP